MKTSLAILLILSQALLSIGAAAPAAAQADRPAPLDDPATALVIIDIQDFYFPGGALPLHEPEAAAAKAGRLLAAFREQGRLVVHVGHRAQSGTAFAAAVTPREDEAVVMKSEVNAFRGTDLKTILDDAGITRVVLCGMQTHMCLEGATRAAADFGYDVIVVGDACATRDLHRGETVVNAEDVHAATLATLDGVYARVVDAEALLDGN